MTEEWQTTQLLDMGFDLNQIQEAQKHVGSTNIDEAINWIVSNTGVANTDSITTDNIAQSSSGNTATESEPKEKTIDEQKKDETSADSTPAPADLLAKSLKCEECGKLLKSAEEAEFHAIKTNHSQFSESTDEVKPLTEEEKQERLTKLQQRIKEKRIENEQEERRKHDELEKKRRMVGKEVLSAKEKYREQEMKRAAELSKKERQDDLLAKQKIKLEIEKDKEERRLKFTQQNAEFKQKADNIAITSSPAKKDYSECRLQIRLPSGDAIVHKFAVSATLQSVHDYILQQKPLLGPKLSLKSTTSFPVRVFTENEFSSSLTDLGLVPSAVILVVKNNFVNQNF